MTDHSNVSEVRGGGLDKGVPTYNQTRPVEYHPIGSLTIAAGGAGANYACPGTGTVYDIKGLKLQLSFAAVGNNLVGGDVLAVTFYQLRDGTYYLLDSVNATVPAVTAGSIGKVEVNPDFTDGSELHGATHFAVTGTVAVAAGGIPGSTLYVDYDLYADEDIDLEFSGSIGAVKLEDGATAQRATVNASGELLVKDTTADTLLGTIDSDTSGIATGIGAVTDAPVADNTTVEDATARSEISLLKRVANLLIALLKQAYISATNHFRTAEISPLDTRDVLISAIASNATINNTALYYPAGAATPTSNWDSFTLNAAGGKARRISFNGSSIPPNTKTAIITLYASNDPNATSASKRWTQIAFIDDMTGNTVTSLTMTGNAGGTAQPFAISVGKNFDYRYLVMLVTTNDNTTAVYIDGAAGY